MTPALCRIHCPEELVHLLSGRLVLLGQPTRIRILDELRSGERSVQSIADGPTTTQQNVSGHLRLLRANGGRLTPTNGTNGDLRRSRRQRVRSVAAVARRLAAAAGRGGRRLITSAEEEGRLDCAYRPGRCRRPLPSLGKAWLVSCRAQVERQDPHRSSGTGTTLTLRPEPPCCKRIRLRTEPGRRSPALVAAATGCGVSGSAGGRCLSGRAEPR